MQFLMSGFRCGNVLTMAVLSFALAGCAQTNPVGSNFTQKSDNGTTDIINGPPGVLGIREEGLNWAATGSASVKAVRVNGDGVLQLGSGPATRQVFWNPANQTFVLSSETDFGVDRATVYNDDGTPKYSVEGFRTSSSEPTKSLAVTLEQVKEIVAILAPEQRKALEAKFRAQAEAAKNAGEAAAPVLIKLIEMLATGG